MPSGTRPMQLCCGSKFAPRTRESTSNQHWLILSCAQRSVARMSIVPSSPPFLDCSADFCLYGTVAWVPNRIEPIVFFCLFRQLDIALGQMFPFSFQQRALFPRCSGANFLREMAIFLSTGHF